MGKPVLVVGGHGPGISDAVARRYGREGYALALLARNAERLQGAAAAHGPDAKAYPTDLADDRAVTATIARIRAEQGTIGAIHWTAYAPGAGNLLTAPVSELRAHVDVGVVGLVAAIQAALADLEATKGAVLVAGGGLGFHDPSLATLANQWGVMGLSVAKAAQHKTCAVLAEALRPRGVHLAEIVVTGIVRGTAFDRGQPKTIDPDAIAERFWAMHQGRTEHTTRFA